jgi:hypothetical protein
MVTVKRFGLLLVRYPHTLSGPLSLRQGRKWERFFFSDKELIFLFLKKKKKKKERKIKIKYLKRENEA